MLWKRKRSPEEVPTPVAVALSDWCRRAKHPAPPAEVREALAHLEPEEDFRVRALADSEPEATPLGPFAAVDILFGASPSLAAVREGCGYYELARLTSLQAVPPSSVQPERSPTGGVEGSGDQSHRDRQRDSADHEMHGSADPSTPVLRTYAQDERRSVSERIAPRKRARLPEPGPVSEPEASDFSPPGAPRALPQPRGRFTRLAAQKQPSSDLFTPAAKDELAAAMEQHTHRFALLRILSERYATRGREALSPEDLENALGHHGLLERLVAQERKAVLGGFTEHRGAAGRVAWALGLRPDELKRLIERAGLRPEVESLRERFQREALAPKRLSAQLDLLGRTRYLADLGIAEKFQSQLRRDLDALLEPWIDRVANLDELARRVGEDQSAPAVRLTRAFEKLGLTESLERRIAAGQRSGEPSQP